MLDIETIKANGLCAGCGLCAGIDGSIAMHDSAEGFRRPRATGPIPADVAALIDRVCPGANVVHEQSERGGPDYHPIWGPLVAARLGWSSDPALRRNASSGGGLSAILLHLLESGTADYVVQTAVAATSPVRNALAISTGRDDVFRAAGSRYAPSSPLEDIGERLDAPGRFAFVGKPCDVAGLRQLARVDPRVDEKVVCMIAFMCAGVPSYRGTSAVLSAMGIADENAVAAFRYRGDGWPGFATAQLEDGTKATIDYATSWGAILNRHLQFRCKICPDGIGEFADVVCADGWHCDAQGNPLFGEREGRSIVLTRSARGEALVAEAIATGALVTEPLAVETISNMQPFQAKRKGLVVSRLAAMALTGRRLPRYRGLALTENVRRLGLAESARSFLGTLRRLVGGRIAADTGPTLSQRTGRQG
ncbi:coenzyme F420-reducing hydrogenase subunit beta [Tsuneonella dongtanensis]|uniref:Coenzyme F420-reducing hydrogenase subunit beta n=1 Tax=Tsuneonella dongtanensis TaxID=692370 RepID=A0A1B2ABF9_9SPHN|nr:Coenzyme F420 hydrogenase/dehydrogenase, beta subunit C-terminal domain [Tsuneonella dongtanensis]ANY19418.1 coenzyme F420-reducing hydrogenase subunit beta [Tsuneonella dongtanensis]